MNKDKLKLLIEKLKAAEKKDYDAIVAEAGKENNLKPVEVWKLLKEEGYDPKTGFLANILGGQSRNDEKKQNVILRHKTEYPRYRRAGLVLTQKAQTYEVTDEQLAMLKKDPWIVIGDGKKEGENK